MDEVIEEVRVTRLPEGRRGHITRSGREQPPAVAVGGSPGSSNGDARSKPVSRVRKKHRMAVALRDAAIEAPPQVRLRSRDGANAVEKGEWVDPDDIRPNQRTGRVVRGYWSMPSLRRIQRVSREITDEHVLAGEYICAYYDIAKFGFQAERDGLPVTQLVHLPRLDFSAGAHAQARALDIFTRIWKTLNATQQRMLKVIVLQNQSVKSWCDKEEQRIGARPNDKIELGYLKCMMDGLAKFLEADIAEARQQNRIRA